MSNYPLIKPAPPRLSELTEELRELEQSGTFSNFGPVNRRFEQRLLQGMFGGRGGCLTVCNATLGLMLAIKHATERRTPRQRYALMPSFTFAAAAQAALWCGLTPLFCDIEEQSWAADPAAEVSLLERYADEVAVVVPYATYGYELDLGHYRRLTERFGVPVVVDAAASLGTSTADGSNFGTGFPGAVVFSMHVTKAFATSEGGVIYSADAALVETLRVMCNFGFGQPRVATMPGLNAKLSEIAALVALERLKDFPKSVRHRARLMLHYRASLPELSFQGGNLAQQSHQFAAALLPTALARHRPVMLARLRARDVGAATYFSPHLAEHRFFANSPTDGLTVTQDIADRMISLPLYDSLTVDGVTDIAYRLRGVIKTLSAEIGIGGDDGSSAAQEAPDGRASRPNARPTADLERRTGKRSRVG